MMHKGIKPHAMNTLGDFEEIIRWGELASQVIGRWILNRALLKPRLYKPHGFFAIKENQNKYWR